MSKQVAELRRDVVEQREGAGRGARYPAALRARLTAFARQMRAGGWSWERIGSSVGLAGETLRLWTERDVGRRPRLVRVAVVPKAAPGSQPATFILLSPTGWRVEGLSLDAVVELIRSLAC
jgi:hypothetical protein